MHPNKSPYQEHPGFYDLDNRKTRVLSPINKEQLEHRHAAMFAEWNLKDKTVLDLGSCLGATGQWVLFHGAKHYTGVEAQHGYVKKSKALLSHHDSKATIIHASIEEFLESNTTKYDVVVMLGVIYAFIDYYKILRQVTSICKENLLIEGIYPYPPIGNPKASVVEICAKQPMVVADVEQHVQGVGSRMSPSALDIVMGSLGFESIGKHPMPRRMTFALDNFCGDPQEKYFVRYLTSYRNSANVMRTVSDAITNPNCNDDIQYWKDIEKSKPFIDPNKKVLAEKPWDFDDKVANNFQNEASTNIPDYDRVIGKIIDFANQFLNNGNKIIDVGCSLGETIKRLHQNGFTNLYGVDSSIHMIERAFQTPDNKISYTLSKKLPTELGPFDLIIANWTLHFINTRETYLKDIYNSLVLGGYVILTDKIQHSEETDEMYKDFKKQKGLSEEYIQYKEEALQGVLVTYPLEWYLITFRKLGFRQIEIINSNLSFTSFLLKK